MEAPTTIAKYSVRPCSDLDHTIHDLMLPTRCHSHRAANARSRRHWFWSERTGRREKLVVEAGMSCGVWMRLVVLVAVVGEGGGRRVICGHGQSSGKKRMMEDFCERIEFRIVGGRDNG